MHLSARWSTAVLAIVTVTLAGVGCGDTSEDASAGTSSTTAASQTTAVDPDAFCAAIEALDRTDGTTEESIVLDVLDEVRRTAPPEISDAVDTASDTLIANNYPGGVEPGMQEASIEDTHAAGERLSAYVDEHCELGA